MLANLTNLFGGCGKDDDIWTWIIIGAIILLLLVGDNDDPCHDHDGFLGGLFEGNGIIIIILLVILLFFND